MFSTVVVAEDTVEFLNGSKASGTVTSIRKTEKEFDFEAKIGSRTLVRTYPFSQVHAVTLKGKRYELTPKPTSEQKGELLSRSEAEVKSLVADAGRTPPDWLSTTPLTYPKTLDLDWPLKPPTAGWQSQKNMGQYIWSVINENPSRWQSGIKLVHHCTTLHSDDPVLLRRDMEVLGRMYFELLQDFPRAAFWYQEANVSVNRMAGIQLAECYFRLGNKEMAMKMMRGKSLARTSIKLLGDMDEIKAAIQVTQSFSKNSSQSNEANMLCGNALRQAGRTSEAVSYYQKVIDSKNFRNKEYENRLKGRARDATETIRVFDQFDPTQVSDGTYPGNAIAYNGRLDVEVKVKSGRIESVKVLSHREKQYYAALEETPKQIIDTQGFKDVDGTSGATITSQAIVNATAKALTDGTN